jgi:hypothetical protein
MFTQVVPEQNEQGTETLAASGAPATTETKSQQLAEQSGSAPEATTTLSETPAQTPGESKGSEPVEDVPAEEPKVVEELKRTRRRAQLAEEREILSKEREAFLRGQLEEAKKTSTPDKITPAAIEDKPPVLTDFSDIEQYEEAKFQYRWNLAEKQKANQEEQQRKQKADQERKDIQDRIDREFYSRVNKVIDKIPDYQEVVRSSTMNLPNDALLAIKESDIGPEVAYYLAKNPSEAEKLSKMSVSSAVREIGKIEAKLSMVEPPKKQTKQVTQAPEPIKPTGGTHSVVNKSYDEMSMEEFIKQRRLERKEYLQKSSVGLSRA